MPKKTGTVQNKLKLIKEYSIELSLHRGNTGKGGKNKKKYNPYGEDFFIDRIVLSDMMDSLVGMDELVVPQRSTWSTIQNRIGSTIALNRKWSSNRRRSRCMSTN